MASDLMTHYMVFKNLRAHVAILNEGSEPQFIQLAKNFEICRQRWLHEIVSCREELAKSETEKGALEDRQMQLIWDLLFTEGSSNSIQLNEEQRSALSFLNARSHIPANLNSSRRLTTIDESASILSDISYDKTDDSLDWDASAVRNVCLRKRQKRHSSRNHIEGPASSSKRSRSTGHPSEKSSSTLVEAKNAKTCAVTHPECRERCALPCVPSIDGTPIKIGEVADLMYWRDKGQ